MSPRWGMGGAMSAEQSPHSDPRVERAQQYLETYKGLNDIVCEMARDVISIFEQLEAALRVVEAAQIAYDGFGEDDHRFYGSQKRLAEALEAWHGASSPAPEPDCFEGNLGANIAGERYPASRRDG